MPNAPTVAPDSLDNFDKSPKLKPTVAASFLNSIKFCPTPAPILFIICIELPNSSNIPIIVPRPAPNCGMLRSVNNSLTVLLILAPPLPMAFDTAVKPVLIPLLKLVRLFPPPPPPPSPPLPPGGNLPAN